jgi:hypothetical protein
MPPKISPVGSSQNSFSVAGGVGVMLLAATTVNLSVATKQNAYTVPVGKICIPSHFIVTNASIDLSATAATMVAGWDAEAVNIFPTNGDGLYAFATPMLQLLTTSVKAVGRSVFLDRSVDGSTVDAITAQLTIGVAGDVLGFLCGNTDTGTVKVYSFGTLIDA